MFSLFKLFLSNKLKVLLFSLFHLGVGLDKLCGFQLSFHGLVRQQLAPTSLRLLRQLDHGQVAVNHFLGDCAITLLKL